MKKYEISIDRIMCEPEGERVVAGGTVSVDGEEFELLYERDSETESVEMTGEKLLMAYYSDRGPYVSIGTDSKYHKAFKKSTFDRAEEFAKEVYKCVVKKVNKAVPAEAELLHRPL